jgi:hypothetical protein
MWHEEEGYPDKEDDYVCWDGTTAEEIVKTRKEDAANQHKEYYPPDDPEPIR